MAAVTQRVGNYLGGVSRQTDDKKTPGQVTELINGYPDVTIGLTKRPGFKFISTLKNSSGTAYSGTSLDGARWFYINRDTDTEKYIGCITAKVGNTNGTVLIWNAITGAACTIDSTTEDAIGIKQWVTNTTYKVGDIVRGISTNDSLRVMNVYGLVNLELMDQQVQHLLSMVMVKQQYMTILLIGLEILLMQLMML